MVNAFKTLKFRNKIIVIFILAVLVVMASILMALPAIKTTVLNSAKQELITTTNLAATSAESLYKNAIRNYLRGITETHLNTLKLKYKQYQAGEITKQEVIEQFEEIVSSQVIGKTGYMVVSDFADKDRITTLVHPFIKGQRIDQYAFVQRMYIQKEGYFENQWQNPNDPFPRLKAAYMSYFEPWEWIISVHPYKDEFSSLINIEEFKHSLSKVQPSTLEGSYVSIFNGQGDLMYHPTFTEENVFNAQDAVTGAFFVQEIISSINERKDDSTISGWKEFTYNQRGKEDVPVEKLMRYQYVPSQDWIIATIINKDEVLKPYLSLLQQLVIIGAMLFVVISLLAFFSGRYLTHRINSLVIAAKNLSRNKYDLDLERTADDEIGDLEDAMGTAAQTIEHLLMEQKRLNANLEDKVEQRTKELALKNEELGKLYITDSLTGLFNRHKLDAVLKEEADRCSRYKKVFGLIIIDIDHFKHVNDSYGHQVGDTVLQEFAEILKSSSRKTDTVGRWGGEEFMIICSETSLEGTQALAAMLKDKISTYPFSPGEKRAASFGVSAYLIDDELHDLVKRVDSALYKAKNSGRNNIQTL
ncbi:MULTISPECIES: diguanylate cyclase [unclassified Neptuniibacter]|uniref:sensor domain-containing diguanylate cyclase n=1 Tax=unclassified Neptuniibacter TaxID=2630693 RepID=UPI000C4BAE66|nr:MULTISPECIES: diguanylate cyclase [unclassified Neptuniibacter]MAY42353.1 hypothetical protein [Oceanospirillaceae bacterium]|tara:strand:+ start:720 stop:2480 length:1761 start_codon:yes stop_codon:yes gene_type:complete